MADRTLTPFADKAAEVSQIQFAQPDMGKVEQIARQANNIFESNIGQVKSDYNSILNVPVTGEEAQERKQKYIKDAQNTIKQVAKGDLTMPQNVLQAESAFAPMWEDQDLITNISLTKFYQEEQQKLDSWQSSSDPNIRKQYNDYSREDIQNSLTKLGKSPLSRSAYAQLTKRGAVAFADIPIEVTQQYEKEKNEGVETVDIIGDAVMTHHNGIKSLPSFRTYVASRFGDKYDQQLKVVADVLETRQRNDIKKYHPKMNDIEISQQSAKENIQNIAKGYTSMRDNYTSVAVDWDSKIKILEAQKKSNKGSFTQVQQQELDLAKSQKKAYEDEALNYQQQYDKSGLGDENSENYKKLFSELAEHPSDYIWQIRKNQQIDEIATGMSSNNIKESYTLNPVADAYNKNRIEQSKINVDLSRVNATNYGTDMTWMNQNGTYPPSYGKMAGQPIPGWKNPNMGKSGSGTGVNADGTPVKAGSKDDVNLYPNKATPEGTNTVDESKIPIDNIQKTQATLAQDIHDKIYRSDGTGLISMLKEETFVDKDGKIVTIEKQDLDNIEGLAQKMSTGQRPDNSDDNKLVSWNKLKQVLLKNGIIKTEDEIKGPTSMENAIERLGELKGGQMIHKTVADIQEGDVTKLLVETYGDLTKFSVKKLKEMKASATSLILSKEHEKGSKYVVTAEQLQQKMQIANRNKENLDNAIKSTIYTDKTFEKLRNGNGDMVGAKDIANYIGERTITLIPADMGFMGISSALKPNDSRYIQMSAKDLGSYYNDGKVENIKNGSWGSGSKNIIIDNKEYKVVSGNPDIDNDPKTSQNPALLSFQKLMQNLESKYGDSKDFAKLKTTATEHVMKTFSGDSKTGYIYPASSYSPSNPMQRTMAHGLAQEVSSIGVSPIIMTGDESPITDAGLQASIRQSISSPDNIDNNVAKIEPIHLQDNTQAIKVTFNPQVRNKFTSTIDTKGKEINTAIPDISYIFPIASKENAPTLQQLPNKQNFIYDDLYDCTGTKMITSTPQADSFGQKFKAYGIRADKDGKATAVQVTYNVTLPDENHPGKMLPAQNVDYEIPLQGTGAKNVDEIMEKAYDIQRQFIDLADTTLKNHTLDIMNQLPDKEYLKK